VHVQLKAVLACDMDAAWSALHDPAMFRAVAWPLLRFSAATQAIPERWADGDDAVLGVAAFGIVPLGTQRVAIRDEHRDGARIMHDDGGARSGPLTLVRRWHHRMAVARVADGRTLYRDRLEFDAGVATPLAWVALWTFWQWRLIRFRRLAAGWGG
jgi:hypothetical protein